MKPVPLSEPSPFLLADKNSVQLSWLCRYNNHCLKGSILIIALWSLCLLSFFAVIAASGVRQKILFLQRLDEKDQLGRIAEMGALGAIMQILKEEEKSYCNLNESWHSPIGSELFSWDIIDEASKININLADLDVLKRLFQVVLGMDDIPALDLAVSIVDWRDADSMTASATGGAEDFYYMGLTPSYSAKNSDYEVLDELLLVKGISPDVFEKIKDYITIYGAGKINVNTASPPVLLALGLKAETIDKIIAYRNGEDAVAGTKDDNIFEVPSSIVPSLSQFRTLSESELAQLTTVSGRYFATTSSYFMIKNVAQLNKGKNTAQITCVVDRQGKIYYWRQAI